ncbi:MAG TPA: MoaD/ThiS family protein [Anaerolineales bacterium]|nr:MoaD/ThiS family protein [Anaerolineales bacterium]
MTATVRPYGILKEYINHQNETQVAAGQTIRQAIQSFRMPPEVVALVLVNDEQQDKDYIIQDGDYIKLLAVIGGG